MKNKTAMKKRIMKSSKFCMVILAAAALMIGCGSDGEPDESDSPKSKDEINLDSQSEELYDGFIEGKDKAEYSAEADIGRFLYLKDDLEDGGDYGLDEIKEKLGDAGVYTDCISESYIDAGLDGTYELKLDIGGADNCATFVIKNNAGNLKICFVRDSTRFGSTNVTYSGEVNYFYSVDNDSHGYEKGYIDAEGSYDLSDVSTEDGYNIGEDGDLYYNDQYIGTGIGLYVDEYSSDRNNTDPCYSIHIVDKDNKDIEEDKADPNDPYKLARKALEKGGKRVVTGDEEKKLLD